jgi:hypothetical protein
MWDFSLQIPMWCGKPPIGNDKHWPEIRILRPDYISKHYRKFIFIDAF